MRVLEIYNFKKGKPVRTLVELVIRNLPASPPPKGISSTHNVFFNTTSTEITLQLTNVLALPGNDTTLPVTDTLQSVRYTGDEYVYYGSAPALARGAVVAVVYDGSSSIILHDTASGKKYQLTKS
jgi:hypothetical protein